MKIRGCSEIRSRASIVYTLLASSLLYIGQTSAAELGGASRHPMATDATDITGTLPAGSRNDMMAFAAGDRIKVAAFEILARGTTPAEPLFSSVVERPELSAEYTIQQDGNVLLPFLGPVRAAGQSEAQVEKALEDQYFRALGIKLKIALRLLEREPIYVTGAEMRPAVVKYVPGMIVLQALALSGSLDRISAESWIRVDISRERERMHKSREIRKTALGRLQVLLAEKDGNEPSAPMELIRLAGDEEAKARITDEQHFRETERKELADQIAAHSSMIEVTNKELSYLLGQVADSETAMKENAEWVKMLQDARGQGNVSEPVLHHARSELHGARARWHELQTATAQSERKVVELELEKQKLIVEAELKRHREIKELTKQLLDEEATQASIEALLQNESRVQPSKADHFQLIIIRRAPHGFVHLGADGFSALQPGDILQVGGPMLPSEQAALSSFIH
jgi:protein involved in polysaccharide export with SLBB domain